MVGVRVMTRVEFRWVGAVWKAWDGWAAQVDSDKNCQVLTLGGGVFVLWLMRQVLRKSVVH